MIRYCKRCCLTFDGERCPKCGKKSSTSPEPDDLCFLTETEQLWSTMLADMLTQQEIPFIRKNVLGAGLALTTGLMRERVRFFVFFRHLDEAQSVVDAFTSADEDTPGGPDDENGTDEPDGLS